MVKISVIVPVYNVEKYLKKCLDSLVKQKFNSYEVLVVNDGSPDNSQEIVEEYAKKYPKIIKSYVKENGGVSSARNYGISKAKGDYIAFVDSDDYVDKYYLSSLYETAIKEKADIVVCDLYKKTDNKLEIMNGYKEYTDDKVKNLMVAIPAVWNKLFKKNLFTETGISFPDRIYCEDLAVVTRILCNVKKVAYVKKPLYYYLIRSGSLSHQVKYNPKTADIFTSLNIIRDYFKENKHYQQYKTELEYLHIVHLLHGYMVNIYRYDESIPKNKEVVSLMKELFPKWNHNFYYKKHELKYKIVCNLVYGKQIKLMRLILK